MPVQSFDLQIDQGSDFRASWCWIAGGVGVDFTGASFALVVRQLPQDTPVVSLPNSYGSITVGPSVDVVLNGLYFGTLYEDVVVPATPLVLALSAAATTLLTLGRYRYALTVTWLDGTTTTFLSGNVTVAST